MIKCQSSVLGVVILTGIVIALVSAAYVWAGPLITKNVDKANVNAVISFMKDLNDDILYVSSTGSSKVVSADFGQASFVVNSENNQIVVEMSSTVPMINSVTEVPLSYTELATKIENFNLNFTNEDSSIILSGYEPTSYYTNVSLSGDYYNVSVFESSSTNDFELLCIWNESLSQEDDCALISESIVKDGTTYEVIYINESGSNSVFSGGLIENTGAFGIEPSGIVSAKGFSVNDKEYITMYLTYRPLVNDRNVEFKIYLSCLSNCAFSNERKNLVISRNNVVRTTGHVDTYITVEVE